MKKFNLVNALKQLAFILLTSLTMIVWPSHAAKLKPCPACGPVDPSVYTYSREYIPQTSDQTLTNQNYEGNAPLDLEYYWTQMTGVSERLTNISEHALDYYCWMLDEVIDTASAYGSTNLDEMTVNDMYGLSGISLKTAKATLNWLMLNQPTVHQRIVGMMNDEYNDSLESNLTFNVPFNMAVTLEALFLSCPQINENFDDVKIRAMIYAKNIRAAKGKVKDQAYQDYIAAHERRTTVDGEPAGEDWGYIE